MRRRTGRLVMSLALLVIPLLALEVGIRTLVALGRLPEAPAYERPFEVSWHNYHQEGQFDILVVGDSMTEHAIPPHELDAILSAEVGHSVRSYNMASSGADFRVTRYVVRALAREGRLPPIVLIGVSPTSLTGQDTFTAAFAPSPMGSRMIGCGWTSAIEQWLSCQLTLVSDAWAWRGEPSQLLRALIRPMPTTLPGPGSPLEADGFRPGPPATEAKLSKDMARLDAGTSPDFRLGPTAEADFLALVAEIRAAGSTPIGFTIPHSPPLVHSLEARFPDWDSRRRAAVTLLEDRAGVSITDIDALGAWWRPPDSRDPIHLSRVGAPLFTQQLLATPNFRNQIAVALRAGTTTRR